MTPAALRRHAVARSLFPPTSLENALEAFGFVQADPIRAPARAQDLTLRHRVAGYRAGDLERRYTTLGVHEDFFINYGFVTERVFDLMHPRGGHAPWSASRRKHAARLLQFIGQHGAVHPRQVDDHFALGSVTNYWGGSSSATTHLLDAMHYRGLLRVVQRDAGIRTYGLREPRPRPRGAERHRRLDGLVDVVVALYAPLPAASLSYAVRRLRYAVPQWTAGIAEALQRAKRRLAHARIEDVDWYWPASEDPSAAGDAGDAVRLLAPFDPIVWDRRRFELLWQWPYRFEAYTPVPKRQWGYYALPLLWRDRVIGWGNASVVGKALRVDVGYVAGRAPRDRAFRQALDEERERLALFLGLSH